ncbi:hypothetical protein SAMN05444159_2501 [Bradyrhizobium lablabi]|uniref:OpgC protein n=1 Tax=Bradyrhizobium lablabi TaxID=722472 RepID=A0A1M6PYR8_9BRAD|nr:OpgC domain-containing protein [Bradyrhizobium lablabi]SHK13089.1 hypothetical protein SAMN05444159_2501 [Bradyrhizobium lablabi]
MDIKAILAARGRDPRLYLFLGLANWFIFVDHIPHNVVNLFTIRNFGFSGAAEIFIFIAGYAMSIVYARIMMERGFIVGGTRLFKRVGHLYAAYIVLFVIYVVTITHVAAQYAAPDIITEFNVTGLVDHPVRTLIHGLFLESKPLNLDVLQLYIILMACLPPVLGMMLLWPDLTLAASIALYLAARTFDWNLPSFPDGNWSFNPFCWQLLFVLGSWLALGGLEKCRAILKWPTLLYLGIAYLTFAFVMTMAGRFPEFGSMLPAWLVDAFNPSDKTNLAPYRLLHFIVLAFIVTRLVAKDWVGLQWKILAPIIKCGEESLAVFCAGVFLSFVGHLALTISSDSVPAQILVSAAGIAIMTLIAYYISWSKRQDEPSEVRRRVASNDADDETATTNSIAGPPLAGPQSEPGTARARDLVKL